MLCVLATVAPAKERKTLINQKHGFQVSYPDDWKCQRVMHEDPFPKVEDLKAGRVRFSGGASFGGETPEPADWNAAWFNQGQARALNAPPALPTVLVYAHPAAAVSFDEFTAYFKQFLGFLHMELVSAARVKAAGDLPGYQYVYKMGPVPTRVAVFFAKGKRYGLMYSEVEQKDFDRFETLFNELVASFRAL